MCGLVGYTTPSKNMPAQSVLDKMLSTLAHRGPDNFGKWRDDSVSLGHARLSIIDLSDAANQPFFSDNDQQVLVYNGEIYNFKELRSDLQKQGIRFRTSSDTEVLLKAIIYWGIDAINKINGMFAFAFYDRETSKLILGRDRYGIKPLYFSFKNKNLIFASEQKAMLEHPHLNLQYDDTAILEYFTFQNIITSNNIIKDIQTLMPGHFLSFCLKTRDLAIKQYWDFEFAEPSSPQNKESVLDEFSYLLGAAVQRQMVSDVEVGSYLSGGLDTSAIVYNASKYSKKMKTFTCGFDMSSIQGLEISFDEREAARAISDELNTQYHDVVLKSGDMESCHTKLIWHIDEPRIGQCYPNYYASELASQHVKVVLSGTGGDELFAGYPWRYNWTEQQSLSEAPSSIYFKYWKRLLDDHEFEKLLRPTIQKNKYFSSEDIFQSVFNKQNINKMKKSDLINQSLYFEAKTFLHSLLLIEDKISMAHSLETRVPFLDNELVDFAMRCPVEHKIQMKKPSLHLDENDTSLSSNKKIIKTKEGKLIIREYLKKSAPQLFSEATKQGFSGPDASWYRGKSISFVKTKLFSKNAFLYEFIDYETSIKLLNQHIQGKRNLRLLVWSLLSFEQFLGNYRSEEGYL